MTSRVQTNVALRPGGLTEETVEKLLRLFVLESRWIEPDHRGHIDANEPLPPGTLEKNLPLLLEGFRKHGDLELAQGNGKVVLSIVPDRFGQRSFSGYVFWAGPPSAPGLQLEAHRDAVWRAMELTGAPLATAATAEAMQAFRGRTVRDQYGTKVVPTVGGYDRGLTHPHWRMWFGPEYVSFFGRETLAAAPTMVSQSLEGGHFVQLYEKPEEWNRPEGQEAAARFAAALGKRAFYDPENPEQALEAPDFSLMR